jgi:hypothetical protein
MDVTLDHCEFAAAPEFAEATALGSFGRSGFSVGPQSQAQQAGVPGRPSAAFVVYVPVRSVPIPREVRYPFPRMQDGFGGRTVGLRVLNQEATKRRSDAATERRGDEVLWLRVGWGARCAGVGVRKVPPPLPPLIKGGRHAASAHPSDQNAEP